MNFVRSKGRIEEEPEPGNADNPRLFLGIFIEPFGAQQSITR